MRFKIAVTGTDELVDAYQIGLHALTRVDRKRIHGKKPKALTGSVNLDAALADSHPNDPRWDYGIGVRRSKTSDRIVWAEVHPASSSHVAGVLKKHAWLKAWLKASAPRLRAMPAEFVWVASGKVALPANSRQRRVLAKHGIRFAGRRLEL